MLVQAGILVCEGRMCHGFNAAHRGRINLLGAREAKRGATHCHAYLAAVEEALKIQVKGERSPPAGSSAIARADTASLCFCAHGFHTTHDHSFALHQRRSFALPNGVLCRYIRTHIRHRLANPSSGTLLARNQARPLSGVKLQVTYASGCQSLGLWPVVRVPGPRFLSAVAGSARCTARRSN